MPPSREALASPPAPGGGRHGDRYGEDARRDAGSAAWGRRRPRGSLRRPRVLPRQVVRRRRLPQTRAAGPRARPSRGARSGATAASAAEGRVRLAGETAPGPGGRCPSHPPRPRAGRKRKPPAGPAGRSQGLAGGGGGALWPAEARDLVRAKVDLTGCQPGSPPPPSSGSPAGPQGPRGRPLSPPRPPIGPLPFADSPSHWSPGLAPRLGVPLARSPPPRPPVGLAPCPSQSLGTTSGCPRRGLVIPASSAGACLGFALSLSLFFYTPTAPGLLRRSPIRVLIGPTLLSFREQMGSGVFRVAWP